MGNELTQERSASLDQAWHGDLTGALALSVSPIQILAARIINKGDDRGSCREDVAVTRWVYHVSPPESCGRSPVLESRITTALAHRQDQSMNRRPARNR